MPATFLWRPPFVAGRVLNLTGRRSCFDWFGRIVCREPLNFRGQGFVAPSKWAKNGSSHWRKICFPVLARRLHMTRSSSCGAAKSCHGLGEVIIVYEADFGSPDHDLHYLFHDRIIW